MKRFLVSLLAAMSALAAFAQDPIVVIEQQAEEVNPPISITLTADRLEAIKAEHCGNIGPGLKTRDREFRDKWFPMLNTPYIRVHDVGHLDPGLHAADANFIFPIFKADASKRENYDFSVTDVWIRNLINTGTKPYWHLGSSIENMDEYHYFVSIEDYKKFGEICANIIAHYTEGKWDGFHYDIEHWEIWNEPENPHCWGGTLEEYTEMYIVVSKMLKKRFPHLKIGGPAFTSSREDKCNDFIDACAAADAPIDFFSYHHYLYTDTSDDRFIKSADKLRAKLDACGYNATEIHLNEWHPIKSWKNVDNKVTPDVAALITELMIGFQDTPIDKAFFYTISSSAWGVVSGGKPNEAWYALSAYGQLYDYGTRLRIETDGIPNMSRALAACDADGNAAVLLSMFKAGKRDVTIDFSRLGDFAYAQMLLYDQGHKLDRVMAVTNPRGPVTFHTQYKSAIALLKLYKQMPQETDAMSAVVSNTSLGQLKPLNGGFHAPSLKSRDNYFRDNFYGAMHLSYARIHDEALSNSGCNLVDVNLIFPLQHMDPAKKDGYDFRSTDDFIAQIYNTGTKAYYCLSAFGEEKWDEEHFRIDPPKDPLAWAEVCSNIIAHYTKGKWGGFRYDMPYWEIWNSPDRPDCWAGTFDQYIDFYIAVSKYLKQRHPEIKIGGPSLNALDYDKAKAFISRCSKAGAPLDFFSFHKYCYASSDVNKDLHSADGLRKILDEAGYKDTEIHLSQWKCTGGSSAKAAALTTTYMMRMQDSPVDVAIYNSVIANENGVFAAQKPNSLYFMFLAAADLFAHSERLAVNAKGLNPESFIIAGRDKRGNVDVLASVYENGSRRVTLDLEGYGEDFSMAEVYGMDESNPKLIKLASISKPGRTVAVSTASATGIILVKLYRK